MEELGWQVEEPLYRSGHLFALRLPHHVNREQFGNLLKERQIYVSNRGEFIRVSVNVFNTREDIDALIAAIREVS